MLTIILLFSVFHLSHGLNGDLISNFTVNLVKTPHVVILGCNQETLFEVARFLTDWNHVIQAVNLRESFSLEPILSRHIRAKTSVILDCSCSQCQEVLLTSSEQKYFNKTYQWMVWDTTNRGLDEILSGVTNIGPNTQMTYVNRSFSVSSSSLSSTSFSTTTSTSSSSSSYTSSSTYSSTSSSTSSSSSPTFSLFDIHSKGRHLKDILEVVHFADWHGQLLLHEDPLYLQGIQQRGQFNGFQLRVGSVIDRDNITRNDQVLAFLSSPHRQDGVTTFVKYHYELLTILQERLNFTANFRNVRGWAGRLGGKFRLGFLGIVMRNEVDIGTSGAFNRINRFAEFDTIHQSWKFESGFVYRFTTDVNTDGKSGNFLAPFAFHVWAFSCAMVVVVIIIWRLVVWLNSGIIDEGAENEDNFVLKTVAAVCQQGLDPVPRGVSSRTIVLTLFVFTLVMYNYYTSSVVGGLLNSSGKGPKTVADIVNSPLKLSFEDIGYYKVMFKDSKSPLVHRMYTTKVLPKRATNELPPFIPVMDAIPYIRTGEYAFHCELVDAYPEIARIFDANEICDLRIVIGLLETEVLNWIVTKNSMYTEIFRIIMCRAREVGIVSRALRIYKKEKPFCQSGATVYPVAYSGVNSAFLLLGGAGAVSFIVLAGEILFHRRQMRNHVKSR